MDNRVLNTVLNGGVLNGVSNEGAFSNV